MMSERVPPRTLVVRWLRAAGVLVAVAVVVACGDGPKNDKRSPVDGAQLDGAAGKDSSDDSAVDRPPTSDAGGSGGEGGRDGSDGSAADRPATSDVADGPAPGLDGRADAPETAPPAGTACASPISLVFDAKGQAFAVNTTAGTSTSTPRGCAGAGAGPEVVYSFTTTAARNLVATVSSGSGLQPSLYLRSANCQSGTEVVCHAGQGGSASVVASALAPGAYFLVIDGVRAADAGPFSLNAALTEPYGDGESCAAPAQITLSNGTWGTGTVTGTLRGRRKDFPDCGGSADLVFTFTTTGNRTVTTSYTETDGSTFWDSASSNESGGCGPALNDCSGAFPAGSSSGSYSGTVTHYLLLSLATGGGGFRLSIDVK